LVLREAFNVSQQAVKETVTQIYSILNNIDQMLADASASLAKRGFTPLHSGVQCDLSKSTVASIFPYQSSVYYEREKDGDTLGIGVILSTRSEAIEPLLVAGVFRPRDAMTRYIAWWANAAVLEEKLDEFGVPGADQLPVKVRGVRGYDRSKASYWFEQAVVAPHRSGHPGCTG
jgi:hypothetical protein